MATCGNCNKDIGERTDHYCQEPPKQASSCNSDLLSRRDPEKMRQAVQKLAEYWFSYGTQEGYGTLTMKTLLDDALYGIGVSLDEKEFFAADGYEKFKALLREHLAA